MAEQNIKDELLEIARKNGADGAVQELIKGEFETWDVEGLHDRSVLHKFYTQVKSGKKGHRNPFNSWAGYYCGVTNQKPANQFLFQKRRAFARPSPPDIDSDFDYERRQEIVDFLVKIYGRGRVGNIGTYGALKLRSALTRIIKALDIANAWKKDSQADYTTKNVEKVTEILGSLPRQRGAVLKVKNTKGEDVVLKTSRDVINADSSECDDFRAYMKLYPEIMKHADNIEGLLSIFGVHASGIVLSDVPLDNIAPLRTAKDAGDGTFALATQFANEDLEFLGLIKFDVLAISTLTVIADTIRLVEQNHGFKIDVENLPLDATTSEEARKAYALYRSGKLTGVFQCESPPMQDTCVKVGVDRFDDIMAVISLFRPGPMDSIPEYCDRKHGRRGVSYYHPSIEPFVKHILGPTYGVLVYQEQVMKICESLGGMTPSEGLVVIKGIGKKKEDIIAKGRNSFIKGAIANGVPKEIAEGYWDKFITPFASYGFNAAHSCCYAYNSYITAYLKANFPEEFMCAYMNVETRRRNHERVMKLEKECTRMGMKVLPRDINKCGVSYQIVAKQDLANGIHHSEIRPPIHCKGLSDAAAENIVENRPYFSVHDFASKTDPKVVDSESLIALSDMKFFKTKQSQLKDEFMMIREDLKNLRKKGRPSDNIFGDDE